MPRFGTYDLANRTPGADPHVAGNSTGIADVQPLVAPPEANCFLITAETSPVIFTLDGSVPSAIEGARVPAGLGPIFMPVAPRDSGGTRTLRFCGDGGATKVRVTWLE